MPGPVPGRRLRQKQLEFKCELAALAVKDVFGRYFEQCRKAGFNPNQPRAPAGNADGGQWTSEGGGGLNDSRVISDAVDSVWIPGAQYAAGPRGPRDRLPPLHHVPKIGEGGLSPYRAGQVTIENNAQTGFRAQIQLDSDLLIIAKTDRRRLSRQCSEAFPFEVSGHTPQKVFEFSKGRCLELAKCPVRCVDWADLVSTRIRPMVVD